MRNNIMAILVGIGLAIALSAMLSRAVACPFCSVETKTLSEETGGADSVVLAKLVKEAPATADPGDPNSGMAKFSVVEVLKGAKELKGGSEIDVVFFGDSNREKVYLITGLGEEKVDWTTPLPLSTAAVEYVRKLPSVPALGADRIEFFQEYLEHADPLLAQDAYDEFAKAPYADLLALKNKMHHDRILKWVADPEASPSRRRLYLTMLGVCGTKDDVPLLEGMIASDFEQLRPTLEHDVGLGLSMGGPWFLPMVIEAAQQDDRRRKLGLDALVACYLVLRGPEGMQLIEDRFLKNPRAEYTHVYSTIMALRFHGDENTGVIPRERLLAAMRLLLKNPEFADQVILDLSRWEDWAVLDQLVEMFKTSDENGYMRQPVVSYLTVASEQPGELGKRASAALEELEKLDPETVKTARSLMAFGALSRARGAASAVSSANEATAAKDASNQPAENNEEKPVSSEANIATEKAPSPVVEPQGFQASPEDAKTDVSAIPDPAAFGRTGQEQETRKVEAGRQTEKGLGKENREDTPEFVARNATPHPVENPKPVVATEHHLLLVMGVPVVAAAALMGVYWLILRAGAV
ncbi:MAG: hypothetical protein IT425_03595 [Pirellulales bacterium]|nr:hypothetical protein [Pirellulales bacterium]